MRIKAVLPPAFGGGIAVTAHALPSVVIPSRAPQVARKIHGLVQRRMISTV